jgi:hypothetical protein
VAPLSQPDQQIHKFVPLIETARTLGRWFRLAATSRIGSGRLGRRPLRPPPAAPLSFGNRAAGWALNPVGRDCRCRGRPGKTPPAALFVIQRSIETAQASGRGIRSAASAVGFPGGRLGSPATTPPSGGPTLLWKLADGWPLNRVGRDGSKAAADRGRRGSPPAPAAPLTQPRSSSPGQHAMRSR